MSIELAQKIAYGQIDPVTQRPYLSENAALMPQIPDWSSDNKPNSVPLKSVSTFGRANFESGRLEDEFSNSAPIVTSQNPKAQHYRVAKPKFVGKKSSPKIVSSQQKNIKEFFMQTKKNPTDATEKIRNFFRRGKKEEQEQSESKEIEGQLVPTEEPTSSQEMDLNIKFENNNKIEEEKEETNFEEEFEQEQEEPKRAPQPLEQKKFSESFEERNRPPPLASFFKKQGSFATEYDLFVANSSQYAYKNSKSLNKAFKVPSIAGKKDPDSQTSATSSTDISLKRKAEEEAQISMNKFAMKRKPEDDYRSSFEQYALNLRIEEESRSRNLVEENTSAREKPREDFRNSFDQFAFKVSFTFSGLSIVN